MSLSSEMLINVLAAMRNWQSTIENSPPEEVKAMLKNIEDASGSPALQSEGIEEICQYLKTQLYDAMGIPGHQSPETTPAAQCSQTIH